MRLYDLLFARAATKGGGGGGTVNNAKITIQKNGTTVDSFTSNQATDKTINITVPTSAADVSALPDTTKYAAALSLTINSSTFVMTGQLKDQNGDNLGTAQTIDLPLESVVVDGSYNSQTKKVVLTLQNGNTIEFSVADLVSGLQTELSASNKLNPAYINYDSTHRAVSDTEKSTWNGKQDALTAAQLAAANSGIDSTKVEQIATNASDISDIETALGGKVDKETGKGLSTNDFTTAEKTKLAGIAEGAEVNVQANWTQTTTTADDYIKNKPTLGTAAAKNATDTYNATGDDVTTGKAVAAALATLPEPMIFKGSLGTGGTITTLPTASSSNKGYVYKVITAGTYASQSAKVGDTFISDGSAWVLIPSGDEPSGTVTNVAVANGGGLTVSGSPVTSSGTITVGHSNSVTAKTSSSLKKFTYDAYGHVTGSSELSTAESDALASGIDSTKVEQIETSKNNILLNKSALTDIINSGGKNSFDISTITYATSVTVSGTTMTMNDVDSKQYLNFMVQRYQNTTAGSTIASLNCQTNTIYAVEFTKDNTFNTLSMGHNGSQKDGKFRADVSNLTDGVTYVIQFEVINCNKDYGNFSWKNIMITPKSLYQISDDYDDYCPTLAELYALVKSYHP